MPWDIFLIHTSTLTLITLIVEFALKHNYYW